MDGRAIDQKTGIPVCTVNDEAFGRIFLNQSHNYCFALKTLLGTIEGIQRIQYFFSILCAYEEIWIACIRFGPSYTAHGHLESSGLIKHMEMLEYWIWCTEKWECQLLSSMYLLWK
jgi:hypothetical protein